MTDEQDNSALGAMAGGIPDFLIKDDGPAFPAFDVNGKIFNEGVSKLEFFAGMAMLGLIMRNEAISAEEAGIKAYQFADAMIKAGGK